MSWRAVALAAWLCACDGVGGPGPAPGQQRESIVGGTPAAGDPAVAALGQRRIECADQLAAACSATLIAPRVALTAAHCVVGRPGTSYELYFGADVAGAGELHHVIEVKPHPDYVAATNSADLALLLLDAPATATPVPLRRSPMSPALVGTLARIVGFGDTRVAGQPLGVKREAETRISVIDAGSFRAEPSPGLSCGGDSGGPVLIDDGAGETLAGVTAAGDPGCNSFALNVRVDAYVDSFIQPYLDASQASLPAPTIAPAAICTATCTNNADCPADLTCVDSPAGRHCQLGAVPPGSFGKSCTASSASCICRRLEAGNGPDACRCYAACDAGRTSPASSGCTAGGDGRAGGLGLLFCLLSLVFVRHRFKK